MKTEQIQAIDQKPLERFVGIPRIYYVHPWIGGQKNWHKCADEARDLGFSHLLLAWPFGSEDDLFLTKSLSQIDGKPAKPFLSDLSKRCRQLGLEFWIDFAIGKIAAHGSLAEQGERLWKRPYQDRLDPRRMTGSEELVPAFDDPSAEPALIDLWAAHLLNLQGLGISGVRCHQADQIPLAVWDALMAPVRQVSARFKALAWAPEASQARRAELGEVFDYATSSAAWWTGAEPWLAEEYMVLAPRTRLLGFPEDPFAARLPERAPVDLARVRLLSAAGAALLADGWLMPMGFEYAMATSFLQARAEDLRAARNGCVDLRDQIRQINQNCSLLADGEDRGLRMLGLTDQLTSVLRDGGDAHAHCVVLNRDLVNEQRAPVVEQAARLGLVPVEPDGVPTLAPASATVIALTHSQPIRHAAAPVTLARNLLASERIAIENIQPTVDAGRFPAKRSVGDMVEVTADVLSDGHEVLAAELLWRPAGTTKWSRAPMQLVTNDRWRGEFPLLRIGPHEFALEAWWNEFATYRRDLSKKRDAGLDVDLEIGEGRLLLEKFAGHARPAERSVIEEHLGRVGPSQDESATVLLSKALAGAMAKADPRAHATATQTVFKVEADRQAAAFSSWYELFPRSMTDDPSRHGTFRDVIGRLPAIRAMGFDVVYFPPIHPIGKTNRKGRNNTLAPGPDDPGSPYAIGSAAGGHEAIHPQLGSREDFRHLIAEAARQGLEIALDFAIQCSPDHPWLKEHPGWFDWRPDGSIRYAENPPKKYQDIVNVDFYAPQAIPDLWLALRDVVQGWVDEGVRIFRVDNPHTKPFAFWEWLIGDIRSRDPGVIFLAEAFTRPKIMYRLGKVGFSQSYTYFTWRDTKAELTEYLTELNSDRIGDIYRPHFFVNTPDINPLFLQHSGRPGFLIRAALAATLSGLWGVYSGFELCEAAAIPGKEEYLDSEKYQIKPRDWQAPGNIIDEITRLNQIRRSYRALQSHLGLTFYNAFNDNILYFGKRAAADPELILVAVNLDPHGAHTATIEVPLWEFDLPDHASVEVEDLMHGHRFAWHGKLQTLTLEPWKLPFAIWRIRPPGRSWP